MNLERIHELVAEMSDSLVSLNDLAEGDNIEGTGKSNLVAGLKAIRKQVSELAELTKGE